MATTPATFSQEPPATLLEAAAEHLRGLGLYHGEGLPPWRLLSGGVSNWVLHFACGDGVVVKAALAKLRVAEEWLADPTRAVLEGKAMAALGRRLPQGDVPRVLFVDEARYLLGMTCAPQDSFPWKEALLRGEVDLRVARQVGALLGRMHGAAWGDAGLARQFSDLTLFRQLRLDPYHERAAQVASERGEHDLAALLRTGSVEMTQGRTTLVHGDFSPKNLLAHADGVLALDFEVVHWGNPTFDTAFLLTHLALKAIHRPQHAQEYGAAATTFLDAYTTSLDRQPAGDTAGEALCQAGCLLVARADGKSPAEYLDANGRLLARTLGAAVLRGAITDVPTLFKEAATR